MSEQSESRPSRTPRQTVAAALERILTEIPTEIWQLAVADAILLALGEWSELPESTRNLLALPVTINAGEKSDATHSTSVQRRCNGAKIAAWPLIKNLEFTDIFGG
jgi:hypothetical protein